MKLECPLLLCVTLLLSACQTAVVAPPQRNPLIRVISASEFKPIQQRIEARRNALISILDENEMHLARWMVGVERSPFDDFAIRFEIPRTRWTSGRGLGDEFSAFESLATGEGTQVIDADLVNWMNASRLFIEATGELRDCNGRDLKLFQIEELYSVFSLQLSSITCSIWREKYGPIADISLERERFVIHEGPILYGLNVSMNVKFQSGQVVEFGGRSELPKNVMIKVHEGQEFKPFSYPEHTLVEYFSAEEILRYIENYQILPEERYNALRVLVEYKRKNEPLGAVFNRVEDPIPGVDYMEIPPFLLENDPDPMMRILLLRGFRHTLPLKYQGLKRRFFLRRIADEDPDKEVRKFAEEVIPWL